MNEMNKDVTQVTPIQGLQVLCEKYQLDPNIVILFCWQSVVFDFLQRGKLDDEIVANIRALESEDLGDEDDEGPRIVEASR